MLTHTYPLRHLKGIKVLIMMLTGRFTCGLMFDLDICMHWKRVGPMVTHDRMSSLSPDVIKQHKIRTIVVRDFSICRPSSVTMTVQMAIILPL